MSDGIIINPAQTGNYSSIPPGAYANGPMARAFEGEVQNQQLIAKAPAEQPAAAQGVSLKNLDAQIQEKGVNPAIARLLLAADKKELGGNGDGFASLQEIGRLLPQVPKDAQPEIARDVALLAGIQPPQNPQAQPPGPGAQPPAAAPTQAGAGGEIDLSKLPQSVKPEAVTMLKAADADQSGTVSADEFLTALKVPAERQAGALQLFNQLAQITSGQAPAQQPGPGIPAQASVPGIPFGSESDIGMLTQALQRLVQQGVVTEADASAFAKVLLAAKQANPGSAQITPAQFDAALKGQGITPESNQAAYDKLTQIYAQVAAQPVATEAGHVPPNQPGAAPGAAPADVAAAPGATPAPAPAAAGPQMTTVEIGGEGDPATIYDFAKQQLADAGKDTSHESVAKLAQVYMAMNPDVDPRAMYNTEIKVFASLDGVELKDSLPQHVTDRWNAHISSQAPLASGQAVDIAELVNIATPAAVAPPAANVPQAAPVPVAAPVPEAAPAPLPVPRGDIPSGADLPLTPEEGGPQPLDAEPPPDQASVSEAWGAPVPNGGLQQIEQPQLLV